ncbi:MAG: 6-hydroxymethylpterin diphosphokinase MptE-like protein [Aeromonas veronii]
MSSGRVYIAPYNDIAQFLYIELQRQGCKIDGYADDFKEGGNIIKYDNIPVGSHVYLYSPNYKDEIYPKLSHCQVTMVFFLGGEFVFYSKEEGFNFFKINNFKAALTSLLSRASLNIFYKSKIYRKLSMNSSLKKMEEQHLANKDVFIIGNGPSLKVSDLELIRGKTTIACNKIFLCFDETTWRPEHYLVEDPLDIFEYLHDFKKYALKNVYAPGDCLRYTRFNRDITYYNTNKSNVPFDEVGFEENPIVGFFKGESVVYAMVQLAVFIGAKRVFLLGFDHNYKFPPKTKDNLYKISEGEQNHFHENYRKAGDIWAEPRIENITKQFILLKSHLEVRGIEIFNATRGGKLDVFKRVSLEDVI